MAITDLITHIPGHVNSGAEVVGANTPAPYAGVTVIGGVDGNGVATATKNMAQIYNRFEFCKQWIIEKAGLIHDPLNWAQMGQAILALTGGYGTLGTALAPTAAPTAANPATRITNTNGEVFDWSGTSWFYTGGGLPSSFQGNLATGSSGALPATVPANSVLVTGAPTTIANPSGTRPLLVDFQDVQLYLTYTDGGSSGSGDIFLEVLQSGSAVYSSYSSNYPGSVSIPANTQVRVTGGGNIPGGGSFIIPAGGNGTFNLRATLQGGKISTIPSAIALISGSFTAHNI